MPRLATFLLALAPFALLPASPCAAQIGSDEGGATVAIGPQYDSTHVYVAQEDFDRFVASFVATFGGTASKRGLLQVTPTSSQTVFQAVQTPVGILSVFGFTTPVPYPFGLERTGYLVANIDSALKSARSHGADVIVAIFPDPIGRDAVVEWPGGVHMQFYVHTTAPHYPPLKTIPENRVYISPDRIEAFVHGFVGFSHGRIISDNSRAPGVEIGRPGDTFRRVRLVSNFGKLVAFVTDGHLPYPYGREITGYEVPDLGITLTKARAAGAEVLVAPFSAEDREEAMVRFPGGYIAEIHAARLP